MLFSTNDESDPSGGEPLDANYDIEDLAPEALASIVEDCNKFVEANSHRFKNAPDESCSDGIWTGEESAGYDFWMTRVGHGVGFWEPERQRKYGTKNAQAMDEYSKNAGGVDPYVGDDGLIYL
jgi:hypothetical protein